MQGLSSTIAWLLIVGALILLGLVNTLLERRGHRSLVSLIGNGSIYRRRDDFLSRAEAGFYHQLRRAQRHGRPMI